MKKFNRSLKDIFGCLLDVEIFQKIRQNKKEMNNRKINLKYQKNNLEIIIGI